MSYNHLTLLSSKRKLNLDDLMDRHIALLRGETDTLEPPASPQKTIEPERKQRMGKTSLPPPSTPCPDCKSTQTVITKKGLMCAKCGYGIGTRRVVQVPIDKKRHPGRTRCERCNNADVQRCMTTLHCKCGHITARWP